MPARILVAKELAEIFKLISHADRIRLIEELRSGERDVNTLATALGLSGPRVSQHLGLLRSHRIVSERREGRHHFYRLSQPEIAGWIVDGLSFLERRGRGVPEAQISDVRRFWSTEEPNPGSR